MRLMILRPFLKKPVPIWTTVLCLGIGIGINTALFSVLNYLILSPLKVQDPERLVRIYPAGESGSYPDLEFYARENDTLEALFAERFVEVSVEFVESPERVQASLVTANYFSALGLTAVAGRLPRPVSGEPLSGRERGIFIAEDLWRERPGSELGRTLRVNGLLLPVLGVVPSSFRGTFAGLQPKLWIPLGLAPEVFPGEEILSQPGRRVLHFLGRLEPSTDLSSVRANLNALFERRQAESNEAFKGWGQVEVEPLSRLPREFRVPILGFLGLLGLISGLVLLLTCVNAANLQLARLFEGRREIAVRIALGAPRSRLYLGSLGENLLICSLGSLLGVVVATGLLRFLERLVSALPVPLATQFEADARVLIFACLLALLTGLMLGLLPLTRALRQDPVDCLRDQSASATASSRISRWRNLFVTAQVALSVVLLLLGGLFLRSLQQAGSVDPGFQIDRHLVLKAELTGGSGAAEQIRSFYESLIQRLESLPDIASAGLGRLVPLSLENSSTEVVVEGANLGTILHNTVGDGYFETLEIPLLQGRDFSRADTAESTPVAIVNQTMADRFWPGRNPLGNVFFLRGLEQLEGSIQVIAVAANSRYLTLGEEPRPFFYLPFSQHVSNPMAVHVQTRSPAADQRGQLERFLREQDPGLAFQLTTMEEQLGIAYFLPRALASLLGGFGLLGLMLTLLGVYGIVSFFVSQSQRELGIRISLGGRPRHILQLILGRGASSVFVGTLLGMVLALPLTGLLRGLLYGISPLDPAVFMGVGAVLIIATLAACAGPAWKALRLDPVQVLKGE